MVQKNVSKHLEKIIHLHIYTLDTLFCFLLNRDLIPHEIMSNDQLALTFVMECECQRCD